MTGFGATHTCVECPWRKDVPVGRFPPERFESLRSTVDQAGWIRHGRPLSQPIFACHKTIEGKEHACVGFLLVAGDENIAVRLARSRRRFRPGALVATGPLFESYEAMARANGARPKGTE